jgi:hypothetical protein
MKVDAAHLRSFLGLTSVSYLEAATPLAIVDSTLADKA